MRLKMNQDAGRADCPCEGFIDRGLLCDHLLILDTICQLHMNSPDGTLQMLVLTSWTLVTLVLSEKQ